MTTRTSTYPLRLPLSLKAAVERLSRRDGGGWEVVCVRYGRLAGTTLTPAGADPLPYITALRETAEVVSSPSGAKVPGPVALAEETELVLKWLEQPGTRLVDLDGRWTCPVGGAGASRAQLEPQAASWSTVDQFDNGSWSLSSRPLERPAGAVPAGAA